MSDDISARAEAVLKAFKGDSYAFGLGILDQTVGTFAAELGKKAMFVGPINQPWFASLEQRILDALTTAGMEIVDVVASAGPNAPEVDVYRIHSHIMHKQPDVIVVADGGSGIDAVKAAATLASLGDLTPEIEPFFGVGQVTQICTQADRHIMPVVAVMMAASSGAHLTKYANITDPVIGQKKLIVDEAIIPPRCIFDYAVTKSQPMSLTLDGGLDGIAHCVEVYFGATDETMSQAKEVAELGVETIISGLTRLKENSDDDQGRYLLGLGTDIGGYAIMIGGTSGAHLNSFSLVDVLSHGRACALMNPYYSVFFAPAIESQLRTIGAVYQRHGYIDTNLKTLSGRDLGLAVAEGMVKFSAFLGFPTCLQQVDGITKDHADRCLTAAKNPQLDMKLRNMPVPLNADIVDQYMGPILEAAWDGDFSRIKTM